MIEKPVFPKRPIYEDFMYKENALLEFSKAQDRWADEVEAYMKELEELASLRQARIDALLTILESLRLKIQEAIQKFYLRPDMKAFDEVLGLLSPEEKDKT